mgnify:CR=1 FL=1
MTQIRILEGKKVVLTGAGGALAHTIGAALLEEGAKPVAGASAFEMNPHDYRPLSLERLPAVALDLGWSEEVLSRFLVGYAQVWSNPHDPTLAPQALWIIECVAVVPEARGRGLSKAMLHHLIGVARSDGCIRLSLETGIQSTFIAARALYARAGFAECGPFGDYKLDPNSVYMTKVLA